MKKTLKRLAAVIATLSMCMSLIPAAAAQVGPAPVSINMNGSAVTVEGNNHKIKVKAELEMSNDFIAAASAGNIDDGTGNSKLLDLRFSCILKSDLLKKYDALDLVDFEFSGINAESFELVDAGKIHDSVTLVYKLSDDIDWLYEPAVGNLLNGKLTIETADSAKFLVANGVLTGNTRIAMDAQVIISYADGEPIPGYDTEEIQGAKGAITLNIPAISTSDDSDVSVDVVDPSHKVTVDNSSSKGQVTIEDTRVTEGETVTINVEYLASGHRVDKITVITKDGQQLVVERKDALTYEFVMPAGDVTILVEYAPSAMRPEESGVSRLLNADDHIAFMVGDDTGNFRPNANITRAEVAQIFYALLKNKNVPITVAFDDVDPDAWYATAVHTIASLGAVKGVGNNLFDPTRPITRAEFATIAANFAKMSSSQFSFIDVDKSHWAYSFISCASNYGWVAGIGNNVFEPNRSITRAEAATIVNNMLGRIGDLEKIDAGYGRDFPDVDKSHWGWYEINEAANGHDHSFNSEFTKETWGN